MIRNNTKRKDILISSIKMGVGTVLSRVLGLVREQVMAIYFGASGLTDAFLVAYRIPNLLRDLFAEGAFSSAFVPSFAVEKQKGKDSANELLAKIFTALFIVTGGISILMVIFAAPIVRLFAPSFLDDPEKFQLAVSLTQIMSPYLLFVSIAALFMGALNSMKQFFIPAIAPALFNVIMITVTICLTPYLMTKGISGVYSLAIGVFLGGASQAILQYPYLKRIGFTPRFVLNFFDERVKIVFKKLGPGMIGFAASQINLLLTTILATGSGVGAVSWLNYAFRLFQLPVGVLGVSIGNSNLVHFSEHWKKGDRDGAIQCLKESYNISLLALFPSMALLLGLSSETVHVIFEHGKFSANSTEMTSLALKLYAFSLPMYGLYKLFTPSFYAFEKQNIPVYSSIIAIGCGLLFSLSTIGHFGFSMLALAATLSIMINVLIQSYFLRKELGLDRRFFFDTHLLKYLLSSGLVFVLVRVLSNTLFDFTGSIYFKTSILLLTVFAGISCYGVLLVLLGELNSLKKIKR